MVEFQKRAMHHLQYPSADMPQLAAGENELGVHTLVPEADCSYSINVLIYKVLGALALAKNRSL